MTVADPASTIVHEIDIKAPAAKIFAALTDPDQLVKWWGAGDAYQCTTMESDLRVGGTWHTTGRGSGDSTFCVSGTYRTVEPPRLLEYTWRHDWGGVDDKTETLVRFDLDEHNGVTHMRLTHSGFTNAESRDDHERGWTKVFGWLRDYVE